MKRLMFAMAAMTLSASALAADVAVSAGMGQLNYYGRIEIDNASRPELIYAAPIVIEPIPAGVVASPIYLHVPPGHAKNWGRHCARYNACGQPVYFVQEQWYQQKYVPVARRGDRGHDHDRHDDRRDHHGGNGHGHGHGHGKH